MKNREWASIMSVLTLCIVIFAVSIFFVYNVKLIGFVLVALALLCLISLVPFKVSIKSVRPDIIFGLIDNGILAVMAVLGGEIAGVAGAVIGGVVGNAITDGIAGIFEGRSAEKLRSKRVNEKRTILSSAVGKMAGCLLGAGVVLIFAALIRF
jgi:hypothetical protein